MQRHHDRTLDFESPPKALALEPKMRSRVGTMMVTKAYSYSAQWLVSDRRAPIVLGREERKIARQAGHQRVFPVLSRQQR